jgi:hypothetical protein
VANLADLLANYVRNQPFVAPGAGSSGYATYLSAPEEQQFRDWVSANRVPFDLRQPTATQDYDMRGFWEGMRSGDPHATTGIDPNDQQLHYTDYWKTPYHESFSNESRFAGPNAPRWVGDQLIAPDGTIVFDDRRR